MPVRGVLHEGRAGVDVAMRIAAPSFEHEGPLRGASIAEDAIEFGLGAPDFLKLQFWLEVWRLMTGSGKCAAQSSPTLPFQAVNILDPHQNTLLRAWGCVSILVVSPPYQIPQNMPQHDVGNC